MDCLLKKVAIKSMKTQVNSLKIFSEKLKNKKSRYQFCVTKEF